MDGPLPRADVLRAADGRAVGGQAADGPVEAVVDQYRNEMHG